LLPGYQLTKTSSTLDNKTYSDDLS